MPLLGYNYESEVNNVGWEQMQTAFKKLNRTKKFRDVLSAVNTDISQARFQALDRQTIEQNSREIINIYNRNIELMIKIKSKLVVEDRPAFEPFVLPPFMERPEPEPFAVPSSILPSAFRPAGMPDVRPLAPSGLYPPPMTGRFTGLPSYLSRPLGSLSAFASRIPLGIPRPLSISLPEPIPPRFEAVEEGSGLKKRKKGGYVRVVENQIATQELVSITQLLINNLSILKDLFVSILGEPQFLKKVDVEKILKLHDKFIGFFNENIVPYRRIDFARPMMEFAFQSIPYDDIIDNIISIYEFYNTIFTNKLIPQLRSVTQSLI